MSDGFVHLFVARVRGRAGPIQNPCQINFNPHFPVNIQYNSADIAYV